MNNTASTLDYYSNCPWRLPCGYCEKLNRDCPKTMITYCNNSDDLTAVRNGEGLRPINTYTTERSGIRKEG